MVRLQAMGVSRLGQRTDDIVWDEGHENDFFRRMPSALSLALEATDLESLAHATAKGAEVLWECSAEVVLPSEGELRRKIQATTLNGSRRRQGFRQSRDAFLRMPLVAHDARLGELVLRRERPFGRQERGHVQYYAELCALAVHSCFMREQFHRAAVTDSLTGISNRRRLMEELESRSGAPYRLLMLDADGLKQVNDSLGYEDGDLLIVALADTLASVLEPGELAARLGGDELVAVLNPLSPADASARVHRLRVLVDDLPLPRRIRDICHGASVGCVASRHGETPRETLRRAGAEMQRHKRRRKSDRR
jgi:diguanylate cyclase (GGDEF)-like protein